MVQTKKHAQLQASTPIDDAIDDVSPSLTDDDLLNASAHSPLWMVTSEPSLHAFVMELRQWQQQVLADSTTVHEFHFSRRRLETVRRAFGRMIRNGEEALHQLSQLLSATFLTSVRLQSVVIGEVQTTHERFTLTQSLTVADLLSTLDIDLGTRQLRKVQFADGQGWSAATLVANVVDYQPTEPNRWNIHRMTTRIKAEEEIWNKVVDEIFDLDTLVTRDKQLRHLSKYVKDIFGIKVVVGEVADMPVVQSALENVRWEAATLAHYGIASTQETSRLHFVEVKDYSTVSKQSGWNALKSVVQWSGKTFEIQIQPLHSFMNEREVLTRESHMSFKAQRDHLRERVAEQIPLFRFYRDLLRWLFRAPHGEPPHFDGVRIILDD